MGENDDELGPADIIGLRQSFHEKNNGEDLSKQLFKELTQKLLTDSGRKEVPTAKDLDVAFVTADADKSGTIDEREFLHIFSLVKKGKVNGLGKKASFFGGGGKKQINSFRKSLEEKRNKEAEKSPPPPPPPPPSSQPQQPQGLPMNKPPPPSMLKTQQNVTLGQMPKPGATHSGRPAPPPVSRLPLRTGSTPENTGGSQTFFLQALVSRIEILEKKLKKTEAAVADKDVHITVLQRRVSALEKQYGNDASWIKDEPSKAPPPISVATTSRSRSPRRSPAVADRQRRERERRRPTGRRAESMGSGSPTSLTVGSGVNKRPNGAQRWQ